MLSEQEKDERDVTLHINDYGVSLRITALSSVPEVKVLEADSNKLYEDVQQAYLVRLPPRLACIIQIAYKSMHEKKGEVDNPFTAIQSKEALHKQQRDLIKELNLDPIITPRAIAENTLEKIMRKTNGSVHVSSMAFHGNSALSQTQKHYVAIDSLFLSNALNEIYRENTGDDNCVVVNGSSLVGNPYLPLKGYLQSLEKKLFNKLNKEIGLLKLPPKKLAYESLEVRLESLTSKEQNSFVNSLSYYLLFHLSLFINQRSVHSNRAYSWQFQSKKDEFCTIWINDKDIGNGRQGRWCDVPAYIVDLLMFYEWVLDALNLNADFPDSFPFYFNGHYQTLTLDGAFDRFPSYTIGFKADMSLSDLIGNFNRHFFASIGAEAIVNKQVDVSSEAYNFMMSHWHAGAEPWSMFNVMDKERFRKERIEIMTTVYEFVLNSSKVILPALLLSSKKDGGASNG